MSVDWDKFKNKSKGGNLEKSKAGFVRFSNALDEIGYELTGSYTTTHAKVDMTCSGGHRIEMAPSGILSGNRCIICLGRTVKQAEDKFKRIAKERSYTDIGEYVNNHTPVTFTCANGHQTKMRPADVFQGKGCLYCGGRSKVIASKLWESLVIEYGYTKVCEYVTNNAPVHMKCGSGHSVHISPANFRYGVRCSCERTAGFDTLSPAYLYILTSDDGGMMKIGITKAKSKTRRFDAIRRNVNFKFSVAHKLYFQSGLRAREVELKLHRMGDVLGIVQNDGYKSKEWMRMDGKIISKAIDIHNLEQLERDGL